MSILDFSSDYTMGAHPLILKRLCESNDEILTAYGEDKYSLSAAEKIKTAFCCSDSDVFFISGGTQTNQTVISSCLQSWQGVICASTAHIHGHEAGAVEFTGHKTLPLPHKNGKISASEIDAYVSGFYNDKNHDHMIFPGMVYISYPTEYGTIYSKKELEDIRRICDKHGMLLFLDGARLGYGLACSECDLTPSDIARFCDVFYVGGTKVGALLGEAVVFAKGKVPSHFKTMIKQRGAMLAKGRVIGVQFDVLFEDDLYFKISKNAAEKAEKLKKALVEKGYGLYIDSPTNQQFVRVDDEKLKTLSEKVKYGFWEKPDENTTVIRFATSWATTEQDLEELIKVL